MSCIDKNEEICSLIKSQNLQDMMNCVYEILGNPAFVVDMSSNVVCYTDVKVNEENWGRIVLNNELSEEFFNGGVHIRAEHAKVLQSTKALLLKNTYNGEDLIKKSLCSDGKTLGILIVLPYHKNFDLSDLSYVDIIGEIMAYKMISHQGMVYGEHVSNSRFILSLLEGYQYSENQIKAQMARFFKKMRKYWYVCVIKTKDKPMSDVGENIWEEFLNIRAGTAFIYDMNIVLLINCDCSTKDFATAHPELEKLCTDYKLKMGVSMAFERIEQVRSYYNQAVKAVNLGNIFCQEESVIMFQNLVPYDIISHVKEEEMEMYIHPDIQKLKKYDEENGTKLCETLLTYLDCNRSQIKTGNILYIHRNTVNYRINQCKEILGSELKNDTELFAYTMSLLILKCKKSSFWNNTM